MFVSTYDRVVSCVYVWEGGDGYGLFIVYCNFSPRLPKVDLIISYFSHCSSNLGLVPIGE